MIAATAALATVMFLIGQAGPACAAESDPSVSALAQLSIDELANVEITSVSKRSEPLSQAPASIYVITAEDIRRAGVDSLPEALRLASNLEVARLNSYTYSITARGFNSPESANKLLVLIDGRSVYSPLGSNVYWETLNVPLLDIDRIEVISGPGGTLWGANAVNGVVNIITRSAKQTAGAAVDASAGSMDRTLTARLGARFGADASARVYALGFDRRSTKARLAGDLSADASKGAQTGFRIDGALGRDSYTVQGDLYRTLGEFIAQHYAGENLLGRWTHALDNGSSVQLQTYFDETGRTQLVSKDWLKTYDVQVQQDFAWGERQQLVWGGEYRLWRDAFYSYVSFGFPTPRKTLNLGNLFVQDEIALNPRLKVTAGMKLEDNSYSGLDLLPSVRVAWRADPRTLLWSAVSRVARTPSRTDRELASLPILAPSLAFRSEKLTAYEAGYRGQIGARATVSVSAFYSFYDDLRTVQLTASALPIQLANGMRGSTYGVEAWAEYAVTPSWRLKAGVDTLHKDLHPKPGHADISMQASAGQDPRYQAFLRSEMNLARALEFSLALRAVGRVEPSGVPAYLETDARLNWRVSERLELALDGNNLLHARHLEMIDPSTAPTRYIPRTISLSLRARL